MNQLAGVLFNMDAGDADALGMAFLIQAWAQRYVASSKASLMLAMESLFGPLFSVLMGYDAFRWQLVVGGITIVFSAILLEWNVGSRAKGAQE